MRRRDEKYQHNEEKTSRENKNKQSNENMVTKAKIGKL